MERHDAIYARQSVEKADSISIESQIEYCRYEVRNAPCEIFQDKGYSGKNTERPEFQKMCALIRLGNVRRVICYKLDRCSRSILDFASFMELLQKYQVEFVSCTEKFDTSTPMGRAMLSICIVFAQLERETIQQRVADAYHSRNLKGFYMGGRLPFGFSLETFLLDGKKTARYRENPEEADILRKMYSVYANPLASAGDVVKMLNAEKIPNPRAKDGVWRRNHIGRMLANPIYVKADPAVYLFFQSAGVEIITEPGDFIGINGCYLFSGKNGKGSQLILAPHEGIIDADTWLRCRKKSKVCQPRTGSVSNTWLAGKVKCRSCGYAMVISKTIRKNGQVYRYFVCSQSCGKIEGIANSYPADAVENLVGGEILNQIRGASTKTIPNTQRNLELDAEILRTEAQIRRYAAKALEVDGPLLSALEQKTRELDLRHRDLMKKRTKQEDTERSCLPNQLGPTNSDWENMKTNQKRLIADLLIQRITLHTDIAIYWNVNLAGQT